MQLFPHGTDPLCHGDSFEASLHKLCYFIPVLTSSACGQNGNREVLRSVVREQFRRNMHETDSEKIEEQKQA